MMIEINIDGIVGPTHHFGGLGVGNVASHEHQNRESHPKQAALEGLQKSQLIASLGVSAVRALAAVAAPIEFVV